VPVPPEVTDAGVAARVLVPPDLNVNPTEAVVKPDTAARAASELSAPPCLEAEPATFTLADAIAHGLRNNPRLRAARAAIERARGQEQAAFAPFLPQFDLLAQYGVTSNNLAPGIPGPTGFILATGEDAHAYAETEVGLHWTVCDFGRTGGRYRQAVARERIAEIRRVRVDQTVGFDVAVAYLDVLLARASYRVQEDAIRRAESILEDTRARRKGGVALREDVLRAEVILSDGRVGLVVARRAEFDALARLNNAMGRNAGWPLQVVDLDAEPALPGTLAQCLEQAAAQRPEIGLARQAVLAAEEGRGAAAAEFRPRIYVRGSVGNTSGENVRTGWQEGAGLHLEAPIYAGGRYRGELRSAEADVEAALADVQAILDSISLQVNLAYRGAVAAREIIDLSRIAVDQAQENLRLVRIRYRNGTATPTDIADGEAALTRAQQRYFSAAYSYLAALARLDYELGLPAGAFLHPPVCPEVLPMPCPVFEENRAGDPGRESKPNWSSVVPSHVADN
jgi:outer membrane protein TolC